MSGFQVSTGTIIRTIGRDSETWRNGPARARKDDVGGLSSEVETIEADIEDLIADMTASIAEADRFLQTLPE